MNEIRFIRPGKGSTKLLTSPMDIPESKTDHSANKPKTKRPMSHTYLHTVVHAN